MVVLVGSCRCPLVLVGTCRCSCFGSGLARVACGRMCMHFRFGIVLDEISCILCGLVRREIVGSWVRLCMFQFWRNGRCTVGSSVPFAAVAWWCPFAVGRCAALVVCTGIDCIGSLPSVAVVAVDVVAAVVGVVVVRAVLAVWI